MLKEYDRQLREGNWEVICEGLEVKRCPSPDGDETFILCRSEELRKKESAMHDKFKKRIEEGLGLMAKSCRARRNDPITMAKRVGKLLGQNTRSAGLFEVELNDLGVV